MDERDESVDCFLGFKSAGVLLWKPSFFLAFQGIFRLCNRFFMQFFVIIKVMEKLEKKGKGHARVFVGFDLDQVSEDEV
ncbi:initiator RepB protein [Streptococcus sanguinis]|uniref:initiator RepB protein n=1 Tax=Streptococcus sanguinis TaxID=1305 RepID=UPI002DDD2E91|nr:initiator RepB protein [Streptococcus sanguinis]